MMAPAFIAASDCSLLVSLGGEIAIEIHRRILALTRSLETDPVPHVLNIHPAYCSVLIVFDPLRTDHDTVGAIVRARVEAVESAPAPLSRTVELPVCYGGEYGPDLDSLAEERGLTPQRLIDLHSSAEYVTYFIGFVPGFAYLGGLPPELAAPRLAAPRQRVPAGSVGIAGNQTGVYPFETPGGWRLIGRTPVAMFRPHRDPMSLLAIGDRVRFLPISEAEYSERSR